MDACRDAAGGDDGECGGAELNCHDYCYIYDLSRGRDYGYGHGDRELVGVFECDWTDGAKREHLGDDWGGWFTERATGSECGGYADRELLHGGVSPGRWEREPGVLGDSVEPGAGAFERCEEYGAAYVCGDADGEQGVCGYGDRGGGVGASAG